VESPTRSASLRRDRALVIIDDRIRNAKRSHHLRAEAGATLVSTGDRFLGSWRHRQGRDGPARQVNAAVRRNASSATLDCRIWRGGSTRGTRG
jgi:hypothetical protein